MVVVALRHSPAVEALQLVALVSQLPAALSLTQHRYTTYTYEQQHTHTKRNTHYRRWGCLRRRRRGRK
jgi:hypothetical protein